MSRPDQNKWTVERVGRRNPIVQIHYDGPQYAALHTRDGYLRFVSDRDVGWGTSILTMPSYWSRGSLHQGTPIDVGWEIVGPNLVLISKSVQSRLKITQKLVISPPGNGAIRAAIETDLLGSVVLDERPGEAFRPVFLSSMHDSDTCWDASSAYVNSCEFALPTAAWIVPASPAYTAQSFGLIGGSSRWKKNAPSVHISLSRPLQVAGWLTLLKNPNGDNVGLWASSDRVLARWEYTIIADTRGVAPP